MPENNFNAFKYGRGTPLNADVDDTSAVVLPANPLRRNAVIVNYGAAGVFLAIGADAAAGYGIYLAPSGGSYEINSTNLCTAAVSAITASSTSTLAIHEGT